MDLIRVIELPQAKAATSGVDPISDFAEDGILMRFNAWWSKLDDKREDKFYPRDFLWFNNELGGFVWYFVLPPHVKVTDYETVDFPGGNYAVGTSKDGDEQDAGATVRAIFDWISKQPGVEFDPTRPMMGHVLTSPEGVKLLGYRQMENYIPIRKKKG